MSELKLAVRQFAKNPGLTAIIVITMALAIGANTAIFSVVDGVLLKPLPYREPDRLVRVFENSLAEGAYEIPVSPAAFLDWQTQNSVFEGIAAQEGAGFNLTGRGDPRRLRGNKVTAQFFSVLRTEPLRGRLFTEDEEHLGKNRVALLDYGFCRREFGGDDSILGQSIQLDGDSYTIIGILPSNRPYPHTEVWIPAAFTPADMANRGDHEWNVVARLKAGTTLTKASVAMNTLAVRLGQQYPESRGMGITLADMRDDWVGGARRPLFVLFGAVVFLLLVACANIANLLLARSMARRKEFAVRAALGARSFHLFRQLLTEGAAMSMAGGGLGLLLAFWGISAFVAFGPRDLPRIEEVHLSGSALAFSLLLSAGTGLLFGLAPALQARRACINDVLKEGGRAGSEGLDRRRLRSGLIIVEIAMALVLLASAGLLLRSFARLREVDPGFDPARLLTANIAMPDRKYPSEAQKAAFLLEVVDRLGQLPGVESSGAVFGLPLGNGESRMSLSVEGRPEPGPGEPKNAGYRQITGNYFRTMSTPMIKGRDFDSRDSAKSLQVVIVNEAFTRQFFKGEEPLGKHLYIGDANAAGAEVIGVVRDVRHRNLASAAEPEMYLPFSQHCWGYGSIVLRTRMAPEALAAAARKVVAELDPDQPLDAVRPMTALIDNTTAERRLQTGLLGAFALAGTLLAGIGIYGVMAFSVSRRTQEIGIRMALGARMSDVRRMVIGQGMVFALAGLGIGLIATLLLTQFMRSMLFEIRPTDPITLVSVMLVLFGVALAACWIPARRASRVDPTIALRQN